MKWLKRLVLTLILLPLLALGGIIALTHTSHSRLAASLIQPFLGSESVEIEDIGGVTLGLGPSIGISSARLYSRERQYSIEVVDGLVALRRSPNSTRFAITADRLAVRKNPGADQSSSKNDGASSVNTLTGLPISDVTLGQLVYTDPILGLDARIRNAAALYEPDEGAWQLSGDMAISYRWLTGQGPLSARVDPEQGITGRLRFTGEPVTLDGFATAGLAGHIDIALSPSDLSDITASLSLNAPGIVWEDISLPRLSAEAAYNDERISITLGDTSGADRLNADVNWSPDDGLLTARFDADADAASAIVDLPFEVNAGRLSVIAETRLASAEMPDLQQLAASATMTVRDLALAFPAIGTLTIGSATAEVTKKAEQLGISIAETVTAAFEPAEALMQLPPLELKLSPVSGEIDFADDHGAVGVLELAASHADGTARLTLNDIDFAIDAAMFSARSSLALSGSWAGLPITAVDLEAAVLFAEDGPQQDRPLFSMTLSTADITLDDFAVLSAPDARFTVTDDDAFALQFDRADLRSTAVPPLFVPLSINGTVERAGSVDKVSVTAANDTGDFALQAEGNAIAADGAVDLTVFPISFFPGIVDAATISPALGAVLSDAEGTVEAGGRFGWGDRAEATELTITATAFGGNIAGVRLSGVSGDYRLNGLVPITATPQSIVVPRIDAGGIELTDATVSLGISIDHYLLMSAEATLAEGRVLLSEPARLPRDAPLSAELVLEADNVDLTSLAELMQVDGLVAEGKLAGRLPISIDDGAVAFAGAALTAAADGVLRYVPAELPAFMSGDDQQSQMLRQALQNFNYNRLSLSLDGPLDGNQQILLQVGGSNPDFFDGRPVNLNVAVNGPLAAALRQTGAAIAGNDFAINALGADLGPTDDSTDDASAAQPPD